MARRILIVLFALCSLSACSSWNLALSDEKDSHTRTFATVHNLENPNGNFAIKKRHRTVMAEKELYKGKKVSTSFVTGKHRDYKWMSGLFMQYRF